MDNVHDFALRMALVEEPDHFPCGSIGQPVTDHNYIDGVWIVRRLQRLFFRRDGNHFVAGGFQGPLAQERQFSSWVFPASPEIVLAEDIKTNEGWQRNF